VRGHTVAAARLQLVLSCTEELSHLAIVAIVLDTYTSFFDRLINDTNHVLHRLLPPPTTASQHYNLGSRTHTLQLLEHSTRLSDSNFLVRMLYRDCY